jgi:sugar transferase (PEP-CTERM/EpsH1 system associated)
VSNVKTNPKVPLIAHVIFRLDTGGLENGLVNLINSSPSGIYRHAIICVTYATAFKNRITASNVTIIELNKKPGKDPAVYWRFLRAVRELKPDVIHTRNANALEFQLLAYLAGVRTRIHGEHGWDVHDPYGKSRKYRLLRKIIQPFVNRFVVVSLELRNYLTASVRIPQEKITLIYNGVDAGKFCPNSSSLENLSKAKLAFPGLIVIGTVGRMQEVKNQHLLVDAFVELLDQYPALRRQIRLLMIGDGPLRDKLIEKLDVAGLTELSSLPGACDNVDELLKSIDIFVLPSRNEGVSNTVLEAMATGLPIIATRVGGTPEIVRDGITGTLIRNDDVEELKAAIIQYIDKPDLRDSHGNTGRERVRAEFSLEAMVGKYLDVYRQCMS